MRVGLGKWGRLNKIYWKELDHNVRWMGIKRLEKIRTEDIRARAGVEHTSEKIREAWLI